VLEPRALGGGRRAGQDLQPGVQLQRVCRHRDGILAVGSEQLGERDRHLRLPHARGAEQRDDRQGRHGGQDRTARRGRLRARRADAGTSAARARLAGRGHKADPV
jgi:hypothetical protein